MIYHWLLLLSIICYIYSKPSEEDRIVVVCYQKNEDDILDYWLDYHSEIFGEENVMLLDNYSDDPKVLRTLDVWEDRGVRILREQGPYIDKGMLILNATKKYFPDAAMLVPLDIDEFITIYNYTKISYYANPMISKRAMKDRLKRYVKLPYECYGLCKYYSSVSTDVDDTVESIRFFTRSSFSRAQCKKMFKLENVTYLDHGSHKVNSDVRCQNLNTIGILHYHNRGARRTVDRAIVDAIGFGYIPPHVNASNIVTFATNYTYRKWYESVLDHSPGNHKLLQLVSYLRYGYASPVV